MKIIQISSLWETTPPPKYGGLELVVSNLTEALIQRGHDVVLFATGDSKTRGRLVSVYPRALYRDKVPWNSMYDTLVHVAEAIKFAEQWGADIIHNHVSHRSLAALSLSKIPSVHTIHGTLDPKLVPEDKLRTFRRYKNNNFVSISNFQRQPARYLHWVRTVYNGVDASRFLYEETPRGDYLVWLGRITQTKGVHLAIEVAKRVHKKLLFGAKLDQNAPADLEYFEQRIKPALKRGTVEWVGELGHRDKVQLLRQAVVFLNPILWDEPFGLVTPEANLCGTPVVAFRRGSMPELIRPGVNGWLVTPGSLSQMVNVVERILAMSSEQSRSLRRTSRAWAETHFGVPAMVDGYEAVYQHVLR